MIENIKDLGLVKEEGEEATSNKLKEKLGLSLDDLKAYLTKWLLENSDHVASELINIAPFGDYELLIEDTHAMSMFLADIKPETWGLRQVETIQNQVA